VRLSRCVCWCNFSSVSQPKVCTLRLSSCSSMSFSSSLRISSTLRQSIKHPFPRGAVSSGVSGSQPIIVPRDSEAESSVSGNGRARIGFRHTLLARPYDYSRYFAVGGKQRGVTSVGSGSPSFRAPPRRNDGHRAEIKRQRDNRALTATLAHYPTAGGVLFTTRRFRFSMLDSFPAFQAPREKICPSFSASARSQSSREWRPQFSIS